MRFDAMSGVAQDAVSSVVESFVLNPHTTAVEIARANALLAASHRPFAYRCNSPAAVAGRRGRV